MANRPRNGSMDSEEGGKALFAKVMELFRSGDLNADGSIDLQEMLLLMGTLDARWTEERVRVLFGVMDKSGDGKIQFEEFLRWTLGAKGDEQPEVRKTLELDTTAVLGAIIVVAKDISGETVFGPEEVLGSLTVGWLRRKIASEIGAPVACLRLLVGADEQTLLRNSLLLGAYCSGVGMEVQVISDSLSLLADECLDQLRSCAFVGKFGELPCLRIGRWKRLRIGESASELMFLSDGRILAKEYRCLGYCDAGAEADLAEREAPRRWQFEIAEGSYTIVDGLSCTVELVWRHWARREGRDPGKWPVMDGERSAADCSLDEWEAMEIDEASGDIPQLLPSIAGHANISKLAQAWLEEHGEACDVAGVDASAGFPIPGAEEDVLYDLELDVENAPYWRHGRRAAGPWDDVFDEEDAGPTSEVLNAMRSSTKTSVAEVSDGLAVAAGG
eukprot:TRINITY_DN3242_c0_g1_i2.p1 TRINITY_DN3242_c0_g1~~TRINITY_DN3242_c0_g1_i2.p1  ORF type:complete len:445 (-),score=121.02 TRINITY_DN3242_c0_g1_i2:56-1390(-)